MKYITMNLFYRNDSCFLFWCYLVPETLENTGLQLEVAQLEMRIAGKEKWILIGYRA